MKITQIQKFTIGDLPMKKKTFERDDICKNSDKDMIWGKNKFSKDFNVTFRISAVTDSHQTHHQRCINVQDKVWKLKTSLVSEF